MKPTKKFVQNNAVVSKGNELIMAKYSLNPTQMKLFLKVISYINPQDDSTFKIYKIKIRDLIEEEILTENAYSRLKKYTKEMKKVPVLILNRPDLDVDLFASVEYYKDEGIVEFEFSQKLKPYLVSLSQYTKYELRNVLYLKSTAIIRLYEILKQFGSVGYRDVDVEQLMFILDCEKYAYANFKRNVLEKGKKELMENTDLMFTYREVKKGKKVVRLKFTIKIKERPWQISINKQTKQLGINYGKPAVDNTSGDAYISTIQHELDKFKGLDFVKACGLFNPDEVKKVSELKKSDLNRRINAIKIKEDWEDIRA
jgi:plasmid replication initiation protein